MESVEGCDTDKRLLKRLEIVLGKDGLGKFTENADSHSLCRRRAYCPEGVRSAPFGVHSELIERETFVCVLGGEKCQSQSTRDLDGHRTPCQIF